MASTRTDSDTPLNPVTQSGTLEIDALLWRTQWGTTSLTYAFPSAPDAYSYSTWAPFTPEMQAAARLAFQTYSNVSNLVFTEVADTADATGDIRLQQSYDTAGFAGLGSYPGADSTGGGDVWLSANEPQNASPVPGNMAFYVLMHEIGHALGLKHPYDAGAGLPISLPTLPNEEVTRLQSIMTGYLDNGFVPWNETPGPYDVRAIQYLYGANVSYRTGNDVYTFTPDRTLTIWDAGGTDTISGSGSIDLREGAFSEVDGARVGIAFHVTIENATGGAGNDNLTGNDTGNILDGGAGTDTISAGAGNDSLAGGAGNDTLDGGTGTDTAVYSGNRASYSVATSGSQVTVSGSDGADVLTNVERLQFADQVMLLTSPPSVPPAGPFRGEGDFNFDQHSDILYRNVNGDVAIWQMNGTAAVSSGLVGSVSNEYKISGTGDFNGDNRADILWRHDSGNVSMWQMNGLAVANGAVISELSPDYRFQDTGDFNADQRSDILWRNSAGDVSIWQMDGANIASAAMVGTVANDYTIAGTGDFNGDGRSDLLWRHDSGNVSMWQMNGLNVAAGSVISELSPDYKFAGTGDFNGDGRSDTAWRNSTGDVSIWQMNGSTIQSAAVVATLPPEWKIANTDHDFDGDGRSDILLRNDNGDVAMWNMNGTAIAQGTVVANVSPDWIIS